MLLEGLEDIPTKRFLDSESFEEGDVCKLLCWTQEIRRNLEDFFVRNLSKPSLNVGIFLRTKTPWKGIFLCWISYSYSTDSHSILSPSTFAFTSLFSSSPLSSALLDDIRRFVEYSFDMLLVVVLYIQDESSLFLFHNGDIIYC